MNVSAARAFTGLLMHGIGPWETIYGYYRKWAGEGLWGRMLRNIVKRSGSRARLVDGTHMVAHQCAVNPRVIQQATPVV